MRQSNRLPVESSGRGTGWMSMSKDEEALIEFLRRLRPDSPSTEQAYQTTRLKLEFFFRWKRCHDPQDLADETIRRLVAKLKDQSINVNAIDSPSGYLYTFAKNVYREYVRQSIKDQKLAKGLLAEWPQFVGEQEDCRVECLKELAPQDAELMIAYYADPEERDKLLDAGHFNLSSLRVRIHRIKMKLKACYKECLKKPNAK